MTNSYVCVDACVEARIDECLINLKSSSDSMFLSIQKISVKDLLLMAFVNRTHILNHLSSSSKLLAKLGLTLHINVGSRTWLKVGYLANASNLCRLICPGRVEFKFANIVQELI